MRVSLQHVSKHFGATSVLQDVSFEVADHELFFLLGPSGCGKTTLLRLIAGFYEPDAGEIFFDQRPMKGVPAHRRNTGLVFQNYALWPHLTVAQNVAYGLEVRGLPSAERRRRVEEALAVVQMTEWADRTPNQLSGGQQQRVALARALVIRPDVLLLDEPLSNLDAKLRLELREEIRRIHQQTRLTTLYVTHDQKESLSLADRIAVMRAGRIEQIGRPRDIYRTPASRFVAEFLGETNWLEAQVVDARDGVLHLRTAETTWQAPDHARFRAGQTVCLGFRPEAVQIGPAATNTLRTTVRHVTYLGEIEQYELECAQGARLKATEQNPLEIRPVGSPLVVHVRPQDLMVLPAADA